MFIDQITITVKAGKGGDGTVAFRREKFVPLGGPAGGDGGRGGSIILKVDEGLRTLMDFRYHHIFKAKNGERGMNKGMTGRGAKDTIISVPPGTTVRDEKSGQLLADLVADQQAVVIAQGGRGGRGNIHFASPKNPAPEISENGEPGVERRVTLELKVLADVGLIGFPSVGKSTLLSVITSAKPKIGAYHFTTLVPNLGMVSLEDGRSFAVADMPGLIEGAANGVGLGIEFLRHIERTRVLLHLVDMSGTDEEDPFADFGKINDELAKYDPNLLKRPQIIVATKMDLPTSAEHLAEFKAKIAETDYRDSLILPISAVTHAGLKQLLQETADCLDATPAFPLYQDEEPVTEEATLYRFDPDQKPNFTIEQDETGAFVIHGEQVEKLYQMTDLQHDESLMRFARQLRGMGIDEALRAAGAKNGDLVQIDEFRFEFVD
ncbi:GTPase ObgE [Loigolactobacillus bifermentans]|uniref:GTPase ObgE n=1 Tax=Loigolactobacillus bifermentans TaxID=1607 RepID=UPI0007089F8E|nr:GTPase ObgE [Loigolactobacillus bifermentans]QGG59264.1 GTPase ObgE [Loigolactobacillus bifermentans]